MEDGDRTVDLCQDGTAHSVCWVHETLNCVLRPETLRNVLDYRMCGCIVLAALWDVEALKERIEKGENCVLCIEQAVVVQVLLKVHNCFGHSLV